MRHRVVKKTLGRDKEHRKALYSNLSEALITHGSINTTLAKAKAVKPRVEKLITKAVKANKSEDKVIKFNTVKTLRKHINSETAIRKLMEEVSLNYENTPGGYTRIIKTGERDGDKAKTARLELIKTKKAKATSPKGEPTTKKTKAKDGKILAKKVSKTKKAVTKGKNNEQ